MLKKTRSFCRGVDVFHLIVICLLFKMVKYLWLIFCCFASFVAVRIEFNAPIKGLQRFIIDDKSGDLFVSGDSYLYKLNSNLTEITKINISRRNPTTGDTNNDTILLLFEELEGLRRLLVCWKLTYSICASLNLNLSSLTILSAAESSLSVLPGQTNAAIVDDENDGILIARTVDSGNDLIFLSYARCNDGVNSKCLAQTSSVLTLSGRTSKIYYVIAAHVGKYRYFFSYYLPDPDRSNIARSNIARLCTNYKQVSEIKTYIETPMRCFDKDGENYSLLKTANIVYLNGNFAKSFGSHDGGAMLIGVFQKSRHSSQYAVCTYSFDAIEGAFNKSIEACFGNGTGVLNTYVKPSSRCKAVSIWGCFLFFHCFCFTATHFL